MKYIDLHCDALTFEGVSAVSEEELKAGGCLLQCFAAFVDGRRGEGLPRALALCENFCALCGKWGYHVCGKGSEISSEGIHAMLTLEGGEGLGGSAEGVDLLYEKGVRMCAITWNLPNALGFPHDFSSPSPLLEKQGAGSQNVSPSPLAGRGTQGEGFGLTPFGKECVERMCAKRMLVDVSHGSDALLMDCAKICRAHGMPLVASHAGAREVFPFTRNLPDEGIRAIAESGGVVGVYLVPHFLAARGEKETQREALLAHIRHIRKVGGEEAVAFGSDFDGAPPNAFLPSAAFLPRLWEEVTRMFGSSFCEKFALRNALRVLSAL